MLEETLNQDSNDNQSNNNDYQEHIGAEKMKQIEMDMDTIERQKIYVDKQEAFDGHGIVFQEAFLKGMRDLGYKNPAWALCEIIDNSIQASATEVDVLISTEKRDNKGSIDKLVIIDNGNGMIPKMISYAVRWGGTDRENNRNGFGRYGYGLPSSSVSLGKKYTVFSKIPGATWNSVCVDIEELIAASQNPLKTRELLEPKEAELPKWLLKDSKQTEATIDIENLDSGTIVVIEELDRLNSLTGWKQYKSTKDKLLKHFGLIYRHWLANIKVNVEGTKVEIVDPLFLLPNAMYTEDRPATPRPIETVGSFEVASKNDGVGYVRIRASLLPFNYFNKPGKTSADPQDPGFKVASENNGIIVCRDGRQIDLITPKWTKFQNYDRYVKIEIDFDPVLDEFIGITTSKQQITLDEVMWDKLLSEGANSGRLNRLLVSMRNENKAARQALEAEEEEKLKDPKAPLASVEAISSAEKFKRAVPPLPEKDKVEAHRNFEEKIDEEANNKYEGDRDKARQNLIEETKIKRWDIEYKALEEGPFFRPRRVGEQKVITINVNHPFYEKVFTRDKVNRSAWEIILFVLADGEFDARGEQKQFYEHARMNWSQMLKVALNNLVSDFDMDNLKASIMEATQSEEALSNPED